MPDCITAKRNRVGGYVFDHSNGTHDDLAYALALAVSGSKKVTIIAGGAKPREPSWRDQFAGLPQ